MASSRLGVRPLGMASGKGLSADRRRSAPVFQRRKFSATVLAAIGLPFFFLAGFAWPTEVIPDAVHVASLMVPSTSAINGFTRLAQLGAPLADVRGEFLMLWALTLFYGGIVWILEVRRRRPEGRNAPGAAVGVSSEEPQSVLLRQDQ